MKLLWIGRGLGRTDVRRRIGEVDSVQVDCLDCVYVGGAGGELGPTGGEDFADSVGSE